jgi:hypothetical protein
MRAVALDQRPPGILSRSITPLRQFKEMARIGAKHHG